MTGSTPTPSASAQWHTISPHTRPLTLTILELTPLALTLSLSLTPPLPANVPPPHTPSQHLVHHNHHTHAHSPSHGKKKRSHGPSHTPRGKGRGGDISEDDEVEESDYSALVETSSFKDLLSHGVVVSVNGQPWSRIYAHVSEDEDDDLEWEDEVDIAHAGSAGDEVNEEGMEEGSVTRRRPRKPRFGSSAAEARGDKELVLAGTPRRKSGKEKMDKDRAVVVVYGLSPGKEYEVELRVVGLFSQDGGDGLISNSILIPPSPNPNTGLHPRSRANSLRSRSRPRSRSNSLSAPTLGHPTPHPSSSSPLSHSRSQDAVVTLDSLTVPSHDTLSPEAATIIPTPVLNAVDTQAAQLRHLIATAHAEKDHLQTQIKEARRTSQRQEAALKAEMEAVKKAIEKAGSMDLRSKQKALATQEQVKQGWAGAEAAEKDAGDVESGLDTLESRLEAMRIEVEAVQGEWKAAKEREEDLRERDRKARAEEDKKLGEVVAKIDKLKTKKAKKESEKAELEKKLEDLEKQHAEAEKKNEEERSARRGAATYLAAGYGQQGHHDHHEYGPGGGAHRSLSAHPSLNGLSGHYAAGPAYRPRGVAGYQPRFPSAGAAHHHNRPSPTQPSPTHPNNFYSVQHPIPPSATSPAFRPPKLSGPGPASRSTSGPSAPGVTGSSSGVNAAALPFHPTNFPPGNPAAVAQSAYDTSTNHTTSLMPPSLQHRIYLPNVRPRPTPNFHPPPSVLAEQAKASTASSSGSGNSPAPSAHGVHASGQGQANERSPHSSPPAFPPLPAVTGKGGSAPSVHSGPSLASIVTRAVLSPTSALAQQTQAANQGSVASTYLKHPISTAATANPSIGPVPTNPSPPGHSTSPTPPLPPTGNQSHHQPQHRGSLPPTSGSGGGGGSGSGVRGEGGEFPPLSPTWMAGVHSQSPGMRREATPPIGAIWGSSPGAAGRESPISGLVLKKSSGSANGSGSAGAGTPPPGAAGSTINDQRN
ncbi:hypothetical protein I317_01287 [Kwoniella heveanensis CBS 569]|nr:hypothetical protein I317_01287 [Kwoniella heveanensis CBS 569]